jgi:uncharacterized small protein (DUF1192 family)
MLNHVQHDRYSVARPDDPEEIAKSKRPQEFPRRMDEASISQLEEYIGELEAEIARARAEIAKRGGARVKAESFFS